MKTWTEHIEASEEALDRASGKSAKDAHSQAIGADVHIAVTHLKVAAFLRDGESPAHGV